MKKLKEVLKQPWKPATDTSTPLSPTKMKVSLDEFLNAGFPQED